ncbi:MAG TPA: insulinase family protein [Candidatus Luteococcus avicola]|nr:insulinase family protein [Candidatus Luteococcus avicola]
MTTTRTGTARQHPGGEVLRAELPGGLRVLSEHVPGAVGTNLGVYVGVGSRHEPANRHGSSHFLEHVLFKGTPTRTAEQVSAELEARGGDLNAYTTREYTCFHARVLAGDTARAVELLGDMLTHSLVRPADVAIEREVILDEIAMHADDPSESSVDRAIATLFEGSSLAPLVIGSAGSIRRQSARAITAWWQENYRAGQIVVAATGAVDHEALVTSVAEAFADAPAGQAARPVETPVPGEPRVAFQRGDTAQTAVTLAWPGVRYGDALRPRLDLASVALGGGMSSRLFVEVRERRALAYTIDASTSSWTDSGMFTVEWQSLPARTAEIIDVVGDICQQVRREGFSADELAAAQGQLVGQTLLHFENPSARMGRIGSRELLGDPWDTDELLAAYAAVTLDEVNDTIAGLLSRAPVVSLAGGSSGRPAADRMITRWDDARS